MSIDFHRLVRPIDINRLIFIDYYRLYRLISDDRLSSIGHAGNRAASPSLWVYVPHESTPKILYRWRKLHTKLQVLQLPKTFRVNVLQLKFTTACAIFKAASLITIIHYFPALRTGHKAENDNV